MILRYLIEKEFKQLIRNSFLPRLILIFPCMIMLVMPWAATLEIEDLRIAIIDNDHTPSSLRLTHRIESSPYFKLVALPDTYHKAVECIERNQADMLLEIPKGFEKEQVNGRPASALVAINAVNGTKGGLGNTYLQQILNPQSTSVTSIRYRFNLHLDYKTFMVPALMTMLLVTISTTVCLYAGSESSLNAMYPDKLSMTAHLEPEELNKPYCEELRESFLRWAGENDLPTDTFKDRLLLEFSVLRTEDGFTTDQSGSNLNVTSTATNLYLFSCMTLEDYNRLTEQKGFVYIGKSQEILQHSYQCVHLIAYTRTSRDIDIRKVFGNL